MGIIRDSFVIFKNWTEAINNLPEEYQLETYKALAVYGTTGNIPEGISTIAKAMLISFSRDMENNIARYSASVENGKLGGRPRKSENLEKPNKTQQNLEKPNSSLGLSRLKNKNPYVDVNDNVNVLNNNVVVDKLSTNNSARACEETTTSTTFSIIDSISNLCKEIEFDCDFDSSRYDLNLLVSKIKESRYLRMFRSLKELLGKYDEIVADKYKDFTLNKILSQRSKDATKHTYTKEEYDSLFDSVDEI